MTCLSVIPTLSPSQLELVNDWAAAPPLVIFSMIAESSVVSTSTLLLGLVLGLVVRRGDGGGGEDGDVGGLGGDCALCGGMSFLVEECGGHSGASLATLSFQ